ncbi:MAG: imidazole glycerol phosphate synthase subunit HisH [Kiritimatiellaeota bacterium]|nr:imidazole glycerol phosphate synthase subunit HisH [Kiritimatiellota bacterium]
MTTVIDYKAGNLTSVRLAFAAIGEEVRITSDPDEVRRASRLVFPGVGAAGAAMANLRAYGLDAAIRSRISDGVPFLGICLGTQILFEHSEEDGGVETLGILPGKVVKFVKRDTFKIPHMGWNEAHQTRPHPLLADIPDKSFFYFVHSYHPAPADESHVVCRTTYNNITFASMVARDNVTATQFHPEKSGETGLRLLRNFTGW